MAIISDDNDFENKKQSKCIDKCPDIKPESIDYDKSFENNRKNL